MTYGMNKERILTQMFRQVLRRRWRERMDLIMLGCGHAVVKNCYNTCFVLGEGEEAFLVDGGGGSQILSRLDEADVSLDQIRNIFVTHRHFDHLLGILWILRLLLSQAARGKGEPIVNLYAEPRTISLLKKICRESLSKAEYAQIGKRVCLHQLKDGQKAKILGREVTFFDIGAKKMTQYGFSMDLGESGPLVCLGDEPCSEKGEVYAKEAGWLMHEAFCQASEEAIYHPAEKGHSTVSDAARLGERLNVRHLILYHTQDNEMQTRQQRYLEEGQNHYHGRLFIPNDLDILKIC